MLRKAPVPTLQVPAKRTLNFAPTPFMIGSDEPGSVWDDGIHLFHCWLIRQFGYEEFGDFEVAERLNVHRLISDEWMLGMLCTDRVRVRMRNIGADGASAFINVLKTLPNGAEFEESEVDLGDLENYDPWTDRSLDSELGSDPEVACAYIDKFYELDRDEYFVVKRKIRVRPSGRYFQPLEYGEQPRAAKNPIPFTQWRETIDKAASGSVAAIHRKR